MLLTGGVRRLTAVWLVILFLWRDGAVGFPSGDNSEEVRISSMVLFYPEGGGSLSSCTGFLQPSFTLNTRSVVVRQASAQNEEMQTEELGRPNPVACSLTAGVRILTSESSCGPFLSGSSSWYIW